MDKSVLEEKIRAIGTISTWLLGFLALVIATLTSFVFRDLNIIIAVNDFPGLKLAVVILLDVYIVIAFSILWTLIISFASSSDEAKMLEKRLKKLKYIFKWNIMLAMASMLFILGFVNYFLYS